MGEETYDYISKKNGDKNYGKTFKIELLCITEQFKRFPKQRKEIQRINR